jgi:hypothetical protein
MAEEFNKVILFLKAISFAYQELPFESKAIMILALVIFVSGINLTVLFPIIFNNFLIPNIEKKTGKQIRFPDFLKYIFLGHFLYRYILVARYIACSYFLCIFKGYIGVRKCGVLKSLNYTIKMATKTEIFLSLMTFVSQYLIVFALVGIFIASRKFGLFL